MKNFIRLILSIGLFQALFSLTGCSTLKQLEEGQKLYTGAELQVKTIGFEDKKKSLR
ncbi:hypothetical protein R9C00_11840 [Flammeovirgaceae bacterium SG7u.111]|nr:hypothetical protein [Flammeovirgaceae bacterium SG7u.132]WPO38144.1 hypothetical protein R9C00_11840 [Flammeovirgaceae bacterium SG7u.111]